MNERIMKKFLNRLETLKVEEMFGLFKILGVKFMNENGVRTGEEMLEDAIHIYAHLNRAGRRNIDKVLAAVEKENKLKGGE